MLCVIEYFAKSLKVIPGHSRSFETTFPSMAWLCESLFVFDCNSLYLVPFLRYSASTNGVTFWVRCYSRSLEMVPLERSRISSYWRSIVTCIVSEIKRDIGRTSRFFHTLLAFDTHVQQEYFHCDRKLVCSPRQHKPIVFCANAENESVSLKQWVTGRSSFPGKRIIALLHWGGSKCSNRISGANFLIVFHSTA